MMKSPLVSICLPNLNYRRFLDERMSSILDQTFTDWELIVCDSYSDDGAWAFFQQFRGDARVRLYQVPREGLYAGWNEALRRARGEYIYIATSDDTMYPTCLERLVAPLEADPALHVSVCNFDIIDEEGRILEGLLSAARQYLGEWLYRDSIRSGLTDFVIMAASGMLWQTLTSVLFRRSLLKQTGFFRTDLGSCADVEWMLRAALSSNVAYTGACLATWRTHGAQATGRWPSDRHRLFWEYRAMRSVLQDMESGVPDAWRNSPGLLDQLLASRREALYGSFALTRDDMRREPRQFMADLRAAWKMVPDYLWQQLRSGFTLYEGPRGSISERIDRLLTLTGAPWPPCSR